MPPAEQPRKKRPRVVFEQPPAAAAQAVHRAAQNDFSEDSDDDEDEQERVLPGQPCIEAEAVRDGRKELWLIQMPPGVSLERLSGHSFKLDLNDILQEVKLKDSMAGQQYVLNQDAPPLARNMRIMCPLAAAPSSSSGSRPLTSHSTFGLLPVSRRFTLAKDPVAALDLLLPSAGSRIPLPVLAHDTYIADGSAFNEETDDPTTWRPTAAGMAEAQRLIKEAATAALLAATIAAANKAAAEDAAKAGKTQEAGAGGTPAGETEAGVPAKKRKKSKGGDGAAEQAEPAGTMTPSAAANTLAYAGAAEASATQHSSKKKKKDKERNQVEGGGVDVNAAAEPEAFATQKSSKKKKKKDRVPEDDGSDADAATAVAPLKQVAAVGTPAVSAGVGTAKGRSSLGGPAAAADVSAHEQSEKKKKKRRQSAHVAAS